MIKILLKKGSGKLLLLSLGLYLLVLTTYAVFSYSLTAPNLILSNWEPFWRFQTLMWETYFNNRQLLAGTYLGLITSLFLCYSLILAAVSSGALTLAASTIRKKMILSIGLVLLAALPLVFSNNALSYDVFNYIFNAKMVVVYKANPHQAVALDFARDDWTRFMHNTHTPAPYGYGWTVFSLLPFLAGGGKFLPTWIIFRLVSLASLLLTVSALTFYSIKRKTFTWFWLLAVVLNPLLLLEIVSNSHNDLWMMAPALISLMLANSKKASLVLTSLVLLIFSISIKFASVVLTPIWLALVIFSFREQLLSKIRPHFEQWWPVLASLAMFALLLLPRSKQFLPWYLSWVLVWIPLFPQVAINRFKNLLRLWKSSLIILSVSSLWRYAPFLEANHYSTQIINEQLATTWVPFIVILVGGSILIFLSRTKKVQ